MAYDDPSQMRSTVAADPSGYDWAGAGSQNLQAALADLDRHFPPGLRDRPYTVDETNYHDPTRQLSGEYGDVKDRRPMMRNPINGAAIPANPWVTPHMLTAAANSLVEAKARARADILRGRATSDAAVEALANAMGVDPTSVRGMPMDLAGKIVPAMAHTQQQQRADQDKSQARLEEMRGREGMQSSFMSLDPQAGAAAYPVQDPSAAWSVFQQAHRMRGEDEKAAAAEEKTRLAEENKDKIAGVMQNLMGLDPAEAARQAPTALAPFLDQRGAAYGRSMDLFNTRAEQAAVLQQRQQQQAAAAQQKQQAEQVKQRKTFIDGPLDSMIAPKTKPRDTTPAAGKSGFAGPSTDARSYDYHGPVLDQLAALRVLASNAEGGGVEDFPAKLEQAVEVAKASMPGDTFPAWLNDPKSLLTGSDVMEEKDTLGSHRALIAIGLALKRLLGQP